MKQETVAMNGKERVRMLALERVKRGEATLAQAAKDMRVSGRQALRLKGRYLKEGAAGLAHRGRGRRGNRAKDALREQALDLYRKHYSGFGPTLAAEKLAARDGVEVHGETLRRWLKDAGLWRGRKAERVHRRRRARRERCGQMLQLDGSDHAWFEARGPRACLLVLVDDATGRKLLHMAEAETTAAALALLRKWVERRGVPESIYCDRKSVYWSPKALAEPQLRDRREVHSEWGRVAVGNLGIALIAAHSPQAKGRVERTNATLQDRLVKELRLRGIDTIAGANAMLEAFADELNAKFAVAPADGRDAHRVFAPADAAARELAFSVDFERTVARDNTLSLAGACWQIAAQPGAPPPGAKAVLWRAMDGSVRCRWRERDVQIRPFDPKADRFARRVAAESAAAAGDAEDDAPGPPDAPGDPSPGPPGIYRIGAKAEGEKRGRKAHGGAAKAGRSALASASGAALGSRPRGALSSARSKPSSPAPRARGRRQF